MTLDHSYWLILLISLAIWATVTANSSKDMRIVCYYTNWSVYRPGQAKFSPQNINPYLCTHLIYAFGGFTKENTLKPFDKYQDIEKGGFAKFTGLKTYNKNLKTLLAIGGWNEGSSRFSPMVASAERRKELVKNVVKFLRQNHFDGLDLDWEYPAFRDGGKPRDRDNYAQLVKELREEFERESEKTGRPRLLLTMAVPAGIEYINKGYDIPKLTKYLDWMNILSYDYHSAYEPSVNHHAPLFSLEEDSEYNYDAELNIDYTIKHYLKLGADPSKLVMGIPTYGRSFTLINPDATEIGSPADGPGEMGEATRENGYLAYYEICDYVKNNGWTVVQTNEKAMGPYAYKDNQWVGYDDIGIARKKAEYVAKNNLGGIMFWTIDNDDFRGNCHDKPYPIIESAKEALLEAYGITVDNLISPPSQKTSTKQRNRTSSKSTTEDEPTGSIIKRRRNKTKSKSSSTTRSSNSENSNKSETSTYSSLKLVTPSYTTPAPPATADQGGSTFKCEDEGFFPHPKDCKKYFWCLSGAGDSGIVAHLFTCPAGLYFNKAADSCDYTQNVLCNKKLQRATTTTTTTLRPANSSTVKPTVSSLFSSTRSATSTLRPNFKHRTTTEPPTDDEEYEEYEEEEEDKSEEDPKVIKELIELIKKAGGIEELEKQLKIGNYGSSDNTTPSALSKSIFERVLKNRNSLEKKTFNTGIRNSRGPQAEGLSEESIKKADKARPQYTSIARQRPPKTKIDDEEDIEEEEEEDSDKINKSLSKKTSNENKYVNIRRPKVSSTTEENSKENQFVKIKALGEEESEEEIGQKLIPQYINIRRQRPSTTEGPSTSRYVEIRRSTTPESTGKESEDIKDDLNSKYKSIRRGTTTTSKPENDEIKTSTRSVNLINDNETNSKYKTINRGSTTAATSFLSPLSQSEDERNLLKYQTTTRSTSPEASQEPIVISISSVNSESVTLTTPSSNSNTLTPQSITTSSTSNQINISAVSLSTPESSTRDTVIDIVNDEKKHSTPVLAQPRPFTLTTRTSSSSPKTINETSTEKVSEKNNQIRFLSTSHKLEVSNALGRSRRRFSTTSTTTEANYDNSETSQIRSYRPSELADLSSLTAVDFQDSDFQIAPKRRSRPRPFLPSNAEAPLTTAKSVRLEKSRRAGQSDQIKSNSDEITTTVNNRGRKIIRRFRSTTTPSLEIETTTLRSRRRKPEEISSKKVLLGNLLSRRPTRLPAVNEDDDNSEENPDDDENIKLSESNIRESSSINKNDFTDSKYKSFGKSQSKNTVKEKSNLKSEDDENIESIPEVTTVGKVTEPNIIIRTRKIVRKLPTTEATLITSTTEDATTLNRKRTVIRRFRPTSAITEAPLTTESTIVHENRRRKIFIRGRPTTASQDEVAEKSSTAKNEFFMDDPEVIRVIKKPYNTLSRGSTSTTEEITESSAKKILADLNKSEEEKDNVGSEVIDKNAEEDNDSKDENRSIEDTESTGANNLKTESHSEKVTEIPKNEIASSITIDTTTIGSLNDDDETTTVVLETSSEAPETSSYVNNILLKQKDRPSFGRHNISITSSTLSPETSKPSRRRPTRIRISSTTTTTTKDNLVTRSRYRNINRSSESTSTKSKEENLTEFILTTEIPILENTTTIENATNLETTTLESKTNDQSDSSTTAKAEESNKTETNSDKINLEQETTTITINNTSSFEETTTTTSDSTTLPALRQIKLNETTTTSSETTIKPTTLETITKYIRKSTLRPIQTRPNFKPSTRYKEPEKNEDFDEEEEEEEEDKSDQLKQIDDTEPIKKPNRFSSRFKPTTERAASERFLRPSTALPINKFIYQYSTTKRPLFKTTEQKEEIPDEEEEEEEEYEDLPEEEEDELEKEPEVKPIPRPKLILRKPSTQRTVNRPVANSPVSTQKPKTRIRGTTKSKLRSTTPKLTKPRFTKPTEASITEDLSGINREAVKNRNKNLFSKTKQRVMNTPFAGSTTEDIITESPHSTEPISKSSNLPETTTEFGTTLHHIFAEINDSSTSITESTLPSLNGGKVEKLIEVNRIVEIKAKEAKVHSGKVEEKTKVEVVPMVDKIGAISRVTVIKVVDGNNNQTIIEQLNIDDNEIKKPEISSSSMSPVYFRPVLMEEEVAKVEEVTLKNDRNDRKIEDFANLNQFNTMTKNIKSIGKAEIIDGRSHINIITPRPIYSTEASTIALEALFQTESPKNIFNNLNDEILETENSKFVNVRILSQDESARSNKDILDDTEIIPIRVLKQVDEEVTMKAQVVEVKPKNDKEIIKIAPIQVEMARKLVNAS